LSFLPHEEWNKLPQEAPHTKDDSPDDTDLLAFSADKSPEEFYRILAGNCPPNNYKSRKRNRINFVSSTSQVWDRKYSVNKTLIDRAANGIIFRYTMLIYFGECQNLAKHRQVNCCYTIISALKSKKHHQRHSPFGGETASSPTRKPPHSLMDDGNPIVKRRMVTIRPKELIGRRILKKKGSTYNVLVKWKNGESSYECLDFVSAHQLIHLRKPLRYLGMSAMGTVENMKSLSSLQESLYLLMQVSDCLHFFFILTGTSRATACILKMFDSNNSLFNNCVHRINETHFCEITMLQEKCHNFRCTGCIDMNRPEYESLNNVLSFAILKYSMNGSQRHALIGQSLYSSKNMKSTPHFFLVMKNQDSSTSQAHKHIHLSGLDMNSLIGHIPQCTQWFLSYEQYYNNKHHQIFALSRFLIYLRNYSTDFPEKWFARKVLKRT
jgi:hypothetical protein